MANRHLARSIALQSLFEWDFHGGINEPAEITRRNIAEFGPAIADSAFSAFVENLVQGVIGKIDTLDAVIEKAARDWPIKKTPLVDRNVLRLGLYELLYAPRDEVPTRVALNEAIELAKRFGGDRSGKFINGVLGTIFKEMGEPGKFDEPKKKKVKKLTPGQKAKLPLKKLAGAVVYQRDKQGEVSLAFVHDIFGRWTLTKGRLKEPEDEAAGAVREVKEEMNLNVEIEAPLGANEYIASDPEAGKIRKRVTYFLALAKNPESLKLVEKGGLDDVRWFSLSQVESLKTYDDIRPIIEKGIEKIKKMVADIKHEKRFI